MSDPAAFDPFAPFEDGVSLIEASAGTGKTYTITLLYLRLLLERGLPVDRILVVTYTNAAAAELRDRIRARLAEAREVFAVGRAGHGFYAELLARSADHAQARRRLDNALRGFDEAAVFTIHGFCQRVLADRAFESGMPFEVELVPDPDRLLREVVEDFWRRELYGASPRFLDYLLSKSWSPDVLASTVVRPHAEKPFVALQGASADLTDTAEPEQALLQAFAAARGQWQARRNEITPLLLNAQGLNKGQYKQEAMPGWFAAMDGYLGADQPPAVALPELEKFTSARLAKATNKGQTTPAHRFFDLCQDLYEAQQALEVAFAERAVGLKRALLDYANRELEARKRSRRLQSYNDLLNQLSQALDADQSGALARALRGQYQAALIDEFQDTDPVQYAIFEQVYRGSDRPVFFVGDPKQAIYSFRGADIFAYLKARAAATGCGFLGHNWRSTPALIGAVNTLFELPEPGRPFLFSEIPFQPAQPADKPHEVLEVVGDDPAPLRIWCMAREEGEKQITKAWATQEAARATAAEIARLLNLGNRGEARIGKRAVRGQDIAVLVLTHDQGRGVRNALAALGVRSVQHSRDNVFATAEADEVQHLLAAIAQPARAPLVRAALVTSLLGMDGAALEAMEEDEAVWERTAEAFQVWHRLWREHGFSRMFREILRTRKVPVRLLSLDDGERRLTNVLHLADLLQAEAAREHLGMESLVKWLQGRRRSSSAEDEEAQLRLESDEQLVRIVTVHKSKGLQYPIVFCPFMWNGRVRATKTELVAFHDPRADLRPSLYFGVDPPGEIRNQARDEAFAEGLRLLYVALTRAEQRCYLVWGGIKGAETSPLAWLLHPAESVDALAKRVKAMTDAELRAGPVAVAERAAGSIRVDDWPELEAEPYRSGAESGAPPVVRSFGGDLARRWWVASYSALARGQGGERPDYDPLPATAEGVPDSPQAPLFEKEGLGEIFLHGDEQYQSQSGAQPLKSPLVPLLRRGRQDGAFVTSPVEMDDEPALGRSIFDFPRGARPGECLHAIFERLDFTRAAREEVEPLVGDVLAEYGFDREWTPVVAGMVGRVLDTSLNAAGNLRLRDVPSGSRLNELEFYYPINELTVAGLREVLTGEDAWREAAARLAFAPVRGYMKGFIDLVFEAGGRYYLADYKSNWLGADPADYRAERLSGVMTRESYWLQYLIYTVALHRYLRQRLPGYDYAQHFGGVYYLFLRGMDPSHAAANGVFHDRPAPALVDALDRLLERDTC